MDGESCLTLDYRRPRCLLRTLALLFLLVLPSYRQLFSPRHGMVPPGVSGLETPTWIKDITSSP